MPTYEYRCENGHEFELFQRISDPPGAKCPQCGADASRLLSGGAGLLFKGSGFYITDYRNDSYKKAAEADKGASSKKSESSGSPASGGTSSDSSAGKSSGSSTSAGSKD